MDSFDTLFGAGDLVAAARMSDLEPAEVLRLARRIAEEIPARTDGRTMPRRLDAAIVAGAKAGHFVPGSPASEVLAHALLEYAPRGNGKTPPAQVRVAGLLRTAGLIDSVQLRQFYEVLDGPAARGKLLRHRAAEEILWQRAVTLATLLPREIADALIDCAEARTSPAVRERLLGQVTSRTSRLRMLKVMIGDALPDAGMLFREAIGLDALGALGWIEEDVRVSQALTRAMLLPALQHESAEVRLRAIELAAAAGRGLDAEDVQKPQARHR